MNHLGHLFLASNNRELMAGVFLGDFIKGSLVGERPQFIETGIRFHRAVDAFVDTHSSQRRSVLRLPPEFRRYGAIVCDVVYDHFLAKHWAQFSDLEFAAFCEQAYEDVLEQRDHLSPRAAETMIRMQSYGSLQDYIYEDYIERSLAHIATRLTRSNPLDQAFEQFQTHAQDLEHDFLEFIPDVKRFAFEWIATNQL
jgi:acyl carrier protein phosphodiesterase